jgi:signal transduction histidine kinase
MARVVLATSSLFAVWMDPNEPGRFVVPTYTLHALYVAYAVALAAFWWNRAETGQWPLATHLGDIAVCAVFQFLSLGPSTSPFFTYFAFSLFCGALRWGWRGTFWTGALVLTLFLAMGVTDHFTTSVPQDFELNRYITRAFYLAVVGGLLIFLGQHEERLRRNIVRLARWPSATDYDTRDGLARVLDHASQIVGAGRALVVWEIGDEPWVHMADWAPAALSVTRHGPEVFAPFVAAGLEDAVVLARVPGAEDERVFLERNGLFGEWTGRPIHPELARRLTGGAVLSAPLNKPPVSGRVFFTELVAPTAELITIAGLVAREVGASLQQLAVTDQLRELAASEQRLQVARDLHDGVLQSMTAIRFELQAMAMGSNAGPSAAHRDRLLAIERALALEQRELRLFIDHLRPGHETRPAGSLAGSLEALRERVAAEWKVPVSVRVGPSVTGIPESIERAIPPMVHEAVVNALKHGNPSRIRVDVDLDQAALKIAVTDDGRGFPFRGRYDHAMLANAQLGPASLRERAASLGGTLTIESQAWGSSVEIVLPLAPATPDLASHRG